MVTYEKLSDDPVATEEKILEFWTINEIFEKTLEKTKDETRYVFYEGPPTANGKPHFGHLMPRVYKDLFPRYKTMQGYYVERKGGWDTHGLPVELEVEKELGINSKQEIEEFGLENFAQKCKESVWKYKTEWENVIQRMGFWIDLENAYITYTDEYIESVWWALKKIWENGFLYRGHKVLPYCPRCGTGLSSHEVAQGYQLVEDPSIFVKMPIEGEDNTSFLTWTTTPWTIPANTGLAVGKDFDYAKIKVGDESLILAKALVDEVIDEEYELIEEVKGEEFLGKRYEPPFRLLDDKNAYQVVHADFVTLEEGTGIVHTAPAFGEEDYELGTAEDLPFLQPVDLSGRFTDEFKLCAGEFVKKADSKIVKELASKGVLLKHELYKHDYPFCWRCDTPLLYYALESWFVKTRARQEKIIQNNRKINWYPSHMREGRFGDFLTNMKDWALSRDRFWGTPLNIWECQLCGKDLAIESKEELGNLALNPEKVQEIELHRPWVDEIKLRCPECKGKMYRVPYVIDTWFDSGMMHTAQWHYPFENEDKFNNQFPADFISEGQDQTRGWFYTLHVTSTFLYEEPSFKNVVVTGLGLDSEGRAMSKSRGNVLDPWMLIDKYGADSIRWYLFSSSAPWKTRKLAAKGMQEVLYKFLNTVKNGYNFFALYAAIDDFNPGEHEVGESERELIDRWILSRLNKTAASVTEYMEKYDVVSAAKSIEKFVEDLSNWYIRCSRRRFWSGGMPLSKVSAYLTLYESLLTLSKLLAPFIPFLAEDIYVNLDGPKESVHLCEWPSPDEDLRNPDLERDMAMARDVVTLGRATRNEAGIKVRQPLRRLIVKQTKNVESLKDSPLLDLLRKELNVKQIEFAEDTSKYYSPRVEVNLSKVGPKYGKLTDRVVRTVKKTDPQTIIESLTDKRKYVLKLEDEKREVELTEDMLEVSYQPREGFVEAKERKEEVLIETAIDHQLRQEGYIRELIHQIQLMRKEASFEVTDRIEVFYQTDEELKDAIGEYKDYLKEETLARKLHPGEIPPDVDYIGDKSINGKTTEIGLLKIK